MLARLTFPPHSSETTQRHKIALEILVSGYIEAYIEFFNVTGTRDWCARPRHSVADSKPDWHDDSDVLHVLQLNLARAEESRRKGDPLLACNSYNQLAAFFESAGDRFARRARVILAHVGSETAAHFYQRCLASIIGTKANFSKKAEIYAQIGLLAEHRGACPSNQSSYRLIEIDTLDVSVTAR